jgi:hypothetical protein
MYSHETLGNSKENLGCNDEKIMAISSNKISSNKIKPVFSSTIEYILSSKQLSRRQHLQLTSMLLSNQQVTEADRRNINRVLAAVEVGQLNLID